MLCQLQQCYATWKLHSPFDHSQKHILKLFVIVCLTMGRTNFFIWVKHLKRLLLILDNSCSWVHFLAVFVVSQVVSLLINICSRAEVPRLFFIIDHFHNLVCFEAPVDPYIPVYPSYCFFTNYYSKELTLNVNRDFAYAFLIK